MCLPLTFEKKGELEEKRSNQKHGRRKSLDLSPESATAITTAHTLSQGEN
jgi:hypothetical protein